MNWKSAKKLANSGTRVRRAYWRKWLFRPKFLWWLVDVTNPRTLAEGAPYQVRNIDFTEIDRAATDWTTDPIIPASFVATKSSTVTCPTLYTGSNTATETRISDNSQEEADSFAQSAADAAAVAGLVCIPPVTSFALSIGPTTTNDFPGTGGYSPDHTAPIQYGRTVYTNPYAFAAIAHITIATLDDCLMINDLPVGTPIEVTVSGHTFTSYTLPSDGYSFPVAAGASFALGVGNVADTHIFLTGTLTITGVWPI